MEEYFSFRILYDELLNDNGLSSYDILQKWHSQAVAALNELTVYGQEDAINWRVPRHDSDLDGRKLISPAVSWQFYALSRVSDFLLLPFQHSERNPMSPNINLSQRTEYWLSLGMTTFSQSKFHPFYHEIVEVEQSEDTTEPVSILEEIWPGFLLGHMMFCRAGVRVKGGIDYIIKPIAENSTLYFAHRRKHRLTSDLSDGWGSNSQWRTDFRRDYISQGTCYYNVDGKWEVSELAPKTGPGKKDEPTRNEISTEERIELLTNRCFVRTTKPHRDLWPYDDYYIKKYSHAN